MQPKFIEEILRIFFLQCNFNPSLFVANFNQSDQIIGYNYNINKRIFTDVSISFKRILGYDRNNILRGKNFTDKIVHPQDQPTILECLNKTINTFESSKNKEILSEFGRVKCRAKHMKGYWKYFMIYALDYVKNEKIHEKIGVIVDERIRDHLGNRMKSDKRDEQSDFWKYQNSTNQFSSEMTDQISPRETEILEMISNGLVTKEIAKQLHISESTVITHRKNLISKMSVRNTAELIKKASKHMLI